MNVVAFCIGSPVVKGFASTWRWKKCRSLALAASSDFLFPVSDTFHMLWKADGNFLDFGLTCVNTRHASNAIHSTLVQWVWLNLVLRGIGEYLFGSPIDQRSKNVKVCVKPLKFLHIAPVERFVTSYALPTNNRMSLLDQFKLVCNGHVSL